MFACVVFILYFLGGPLRGRAAGTEGLPRAVPGPRWCHRVILVHVNMYVYTRMFPCILMHGATWGRVKRNRDMRHRDKHLRTIIFNRLLSIFERPGGSKASLSGTFEHSGIFVAAPVHSKPARRQICSACAGDLRRCARFEVPVGWICSDLHRPAGRSHKSPRPPKPRPEKTI